jgi:hypothetical protein
MPKAGFIVMTNKVVVKLECPRQELASEQLEFIRCWLDQLAGHHRKEANKLIQLLMTGKVTDEEACKALNRLKD